MSFAAFLFLENAPPPWPPAGVERPSYLPSIGAHFATNVTPQHDTGGIANCGWHLEGSGPGSAYYLFLISIFVWLNAEMQGRIIVTLGIVTIGLGCGFIGQTWLLPENNQTTPSVYTKAGLTKKGQPYIVKWRTFEKELVEGRSSSVRVVLDNDGPATIDPHQSMLASADPTISPDRKTIRFTIYNPEYTSQIWTLNVLVDAEPLELDVPLSVSPNIFHRIKDGLLVAAAAITLLFGAYFLARARQISLRDLEVKIEKAEEKVEKEPTKAKPAWDLARVKLEAYFDRNLFQVNQVFWLAAIMMMIGFGFVLTAVLMSLSHSDVTPAAKVAALSGIITQFIGATFLVIYKSTMAQANEFMSVLERINTVGMAVQVLDSIPETNAALKDQTRAEIVALLLNANVPKKSKTRLDKPKPNA